MVRTQIQLEDGQYEALKKLAAERSVSMAELVREGVEAVLAAAHQQRRWSTLWQAVGSCHEQPPLGTVSVDHDAHLAEIYRD